MRYCHLFGPFLVGLLITADTRTVGGQEQPAQPGITKDEQGATILRVPPGVRVKIGRQMHKETENCASAKVDIWIQAGRVEYVIFAGTDKIESDERGGITSIRVGKEDCRINVGIEALKQGTAK